MTTETHPKQKQKVKKKKKNTTSSIFFSISASGFFVPQF